MQETAPQVAVVDDEDPVRRGLERLLKSAGFTVESFDSGGAFLDSLSRGEPGCVLLDLHMPGLDGFEVLARLAATRIPVPVLVITGYDTAESRSRAVAFGVSAFLRKPLDGDVLLAAIRASLGSS